MPHLWLASPLLAHYSSFPSLLLLLLLPSSCMSPHGLSLFQAWLPFWCQLQDWEFASWPPPSPRVAPAGPPKASPAPIRGQRDSPGQVVKHRQPARPNLPSTGLQTAAAPVLFLIAVFLTILLSVYFPQGVWYFRFILTCSFWPLQDVYVLRFIAFFGCHVFTHFMLMLSCFHPPDHIMNALLMVFGLTPACSPVGHCRQMSAGGFME